MIVVCIDYSQILHVGDAFDKTIIIIIIKLVILSN